MLSTRCVGRQLRWAGAHCVNTPLSANEMHVLEMQGLRASTLAFGNSVQSLGVIRGLTAFLTSRKGGKVHQVSKLVREGRRSAFDRMVNEAKASGNDGVIGVSASLGPLSTLVEFVSYGGGVKRIIDPLHGDGLPNDVKQLLGDQAFFSAACSGEQYHCLQEAGLQPRTVVFGNEAYSKGIRGLVSGTLRTALWSGEVRAYSDTFNEARRSALATMRQEAFEKGCNFVSGVRMQSVRLPFIQEVSFLGTACVHPTLPAPTSPDDVFTSALPEEELWSLLAIGRRPLSVVTASSVYNLGFGRHVVGVAQQAKGGEASLYRDLTAKARASVGDQLQKQAEKLGADEVVSVRIVIDEIKPGLVEFFAYGTAVKHDMLLKIPSKTLPPQVLLGKRKGFASTANLKIGSFGDTTAAGSRETRAVHDSLLRTFFTFIPFRRLWNAFIAVIGRILPFSARLRRQAPKVDK